MSYLLLITKWNQQPGAMNWVFAVLFNHMALYHTMTANVYARVRQLKEKLDPMASHEFAASLLLQVNIFNHILIFSLSI